MDPQTEDFIHKEMNRLRGRLAGFIEACSLPERQERGLVSTMKSMTYDAERDIIKCCATCDHKQ